MANENAAAINVRTDGKSEEEKGCVSGFTFDCGTSKERADKAVLVIVPAGETATIKGPCAFWLAPWACGADEAVSDRFADGYRSYV